MRGADRGGLWSDRLRVRKPFMLAGGIGAALMFGCMADPAGGHPSFAMALIVLRIVGV